MTKTMEELRAMSFSEFTEWQLGVMGEIAKAKPDGLCAEYLRAIERAKRRIEAL